MRVVVLLLVVVVAATIEAAAMMGEAELYSEEMFDQNSKDLLEPPKWKPDPDDAVAAAQPVTEDLEMNDGALEVEKRKRGSRKRKHRKRGPPPVSAIKATPYIVLGVCVALVIVCLLLWVLIFRKCADKALNEPDDDAEREAEEQTIKDGDNKLLLEAQMKHYEQKSGELHDEKLRYGLNSGLPPVSPSITSPLHTINEKTSGDDPRDPSDAVLIHEYMGPAAQTSSDVRNPLFKPKRVR